MNSPSFKIVGATLGAAVALAAGIVGDTAAADPPRARTAHLWVDTSGGTCARSRRVPMRSRRLEELRDLFEAGLVSLAVGPARNAPLTVGLDEWADWAD